MNTTVKEEALIALDVTSTVTCLLLLVCAVVAFSIKTLAPSSVPELSLLSPVVTSPSLPSSSRTVTE